MLSFFNRSLDPEIIKNALQGLLSNQQPPCGKSYSPEFVRLVPPLTPVDDEVNTICFNFFDCILLRESILRLMLLQMHWIHIADEPSFGIAYDKTTVNIETPDNEARLLMERALKGMLTQAQQHQLVNQLESDPQLIYRIGLTPKQVYFYFFIIHS